mgnify:CR=1 FL=1
MVLTPILWPECTKVIWKTMRGIKTEDYYHLDMGTDQLFWPTRLFMSEETEESKF